MLVDIGFEEILSSASFPANKKPHENFHAVCCLRYLSAAYHSG
jgi:hypothetical protein